MVFSSYIFLFGFLPVFLAVYYLLPPRLRSAWLLVASWVFYGWWRPDFLGLLVGVTAGSHFVAIWIDRTADPARRKLVLSLGVALNLGALGWFKYANFGVDTLNYVLRGMGAQQIGWTRIVLPIGLSFFVFQAISYLVDVYRRTCPPARTLVDFGAFLGLFCQLIAGPVLRYQDVAAQFVERDHTWEKFSRGATRFMAGFCKKVLIADSVSPLADAAFALPDPSMADSWLGLAAYTLQIYFDFSGYSDMAIGLALMIGFRFMENFDHPYTSASITEFWRRWHMSLSFWLRDYLYVPLGGNKMGPRRTYVNLLATMVLGGMWHGANWTFVLWGCWHGGLLAAERARGFRARERRGDLPRSFPRVAWTMLLVVLGWVMFRAADVPAAFSMYAGMAGLHGFGLSDGLAWRIGGQQILTIALGIGFVALAPRWTREGSSWERVASSSWVVVPLFVLAVLRLAAQAYSPFLYFQF